jgi:autotransporter-associated beta strand protein
MNAAAGTLVVGSDSALGTGTVAFTAGTLQAGGGARTLANPTLLTALTVSGSNSLTFSGPFTNSGGNRTLTNSLTAGSLAFSGTTFLQESGTGVGRTMTLAGTANTLFSGPIVNGGTAGNSSLTITNSGTTTLSGANTNTGTTGVNAGTLRLQGGSAIADAGTLAMGGGSVLLDASETVGQLNVTAAGTLSSNSGATLTSTGGVAVSAANSSLDLGLLVASGGAFNVTGTNNTITLSASNSFTSSLVSGPNNTLILGDGSALGSGTAVFSSVSTTLRATTPLTITTPIRMTPNNGFAVFSGSNSMTINNFSVLNTQNNTITNNLAPGSALNFVGSIKTDLSGTALFLHVNVAGTGNTNFTDLIAGGPLVNGGARWALPGPSLSPGVGSWSVVRVS